MRHLMVRLAIWLAAGASSALAGEVGFAHLSVPDPAGPALDVGVWYPTNAEASDQELDLFVQHVAPNAPVAPGQHPLVVISHGTGGSLASHYDTALALARAGFVVAAPTHTGDNWRDQSRAVYITDRPRHVHAVIDALLGAWPSHDSIDPDRVGVFGFSAGGYTALVAIGGVPDGAKLGPYCASHQATFVCRLVAGGAPSDANGPPIADARIKAAVVAAPALGFEFASDGLRTVTVPVQLWRAEDDQILPAPDYADAVRAALPLRPEWHDVANADHFDFLAPCSPALAAAVPMICAERPGFDRAAFHATLNEAIVRFFRRRLES